MKKIALGCGLVVVLLALAGAVGMYYFVYKPARTFVSSMSELGELAELDAKVTNTAAFAPPADGALNEAQVKRFAAVQESMHQRLGARASELQAKYQAMSETGSESRSIGEVVGAYKDLFGIIAEAKRAQVDALNAQQFSLAEYGWVKTRVYEAAGVELTGVDFRELAGKVQNGDLAALQGMASQTSDDISGAIASASSAAAETLATPDTPGLGIPDANRTLVAPYKEAMKNWIVYGIFGL